MSNTPSPTPMPVETDCRTLKSLLDSNADFILLDCRERDEHGVARIEGSTLLPMSEMLARAAELAPHKQQHVVVHCHHGGRSLRVTGWLREQGFEQVQSLAGGIDRWSLEIDPSVQRY